MPTHESTTVLVIGAGPAGLTLSQLLHRRGVSSIVVDKYAREQILGRARAGMLEHRTVETLDRLGVSKRLHAEGHPHTHVEFRAGGESFTLDLPSFYEGRSQHIFPQQEVVQDLLDGLVEAGGDLRLGCAVTVLDTSGPRPVATLADGSTIEADFVAGADGTYGVARATAPDSIREYTMQHEFRWLTLLAEAPPSAPTTIYATHERGFAGHLLRTDTVTRFHLQVPFDDTVEDWPDERIWAELHTRLAMPGFTLNDGPIFSKNMLEMQSRVCEPMQYGRVFLVGDAAHIITPAGGKGMNLAIADAVELDRVLREYVESGDEAVLAEYSARRLPDIWKAQEFSHTLLHTIHGYAPDAPDAAFRQKLQQARLWQLRNREAYARDFAQSFIGPLPVDIAPEPAP
ncbi:MAG: FAD-binding monooxygenase [Mycobacterium sp.]|nr:FAD-binding monooxygenase [Mycobacterium sp.]